MRDFLTGLLQRSLAPAAAVRPRVPSRFEPFGSSREFAGEVGEDVDRGSVDDGASRVPPRRPLAAVAYPEETPPPARSIRRQSTATEPVALRADPSPSPVPSLRSPSSARAAETAPAAEASIVRVPVTLPARRQEAWVFHRAARQAQDDLPAPPLVRPASPAAPDGAEAGEPPPAPAVAPLEQRRPEAVAEGAAARAAERTPSPPSPTIHVTIGRVEVRAAPRPEAPRRAPAPPPMGLDEYLARRAAARRP